MYKTKSAEMQGSRAGELEHEDGLTQSRKETRLL